MNFRSVNKFNVIVNALSGNFLPLDHENTRLGFACTSYMIFTWFVKLIYISATTIGLTFHESAIVTLQKSGVSALVSLEMLIVPIYMNSRRNYLRRLIGKFNGIIVDTDDMKQHIRESVDPTMDRLKMYTFAAIGSVTLWLAMPVARIFETDRFTYTDFVTPMYLPGAPFTVTMFVFGLLVEIIGAGYLLIKKINIDVYISHSITLLTAEYRYVCKQTVNALCQENSEKEDKSVLLALQKCIRHHSVVIEIGQMLTELLSLNVGVTYVSCILKFCLLAFYFLTISGAYFEKLLIVLYTMGNMVHVYILCSCIQDLLEASTSITDNAFHENWYGRGSAVKTMFRTMTLSNQMECRLTAFRVVDLTVPTFGSILNQAYSACLLLLTIN